MLVQFALANSSDCCAKCAPIFAGLTVYTQFITCRPNKRVSNQHSLTITDGVCDGDLCTFTQGGWGSKPSGGNPGALLA